MPSTARQEQPHIGVRAKSTVQVDGLTFRDLDGGDRLTPYEDWRLPPEQPRP